MVQFLKTIPKNHQNLHKIAQKAFSPSSSPHRFFIHKHLNNNSKKKSLKDRRDANQAKAKKIHRLVLIPLHYKTQIPIYNHPHISPSLRFMCVWSTPWDEKKKRSHHRIVYSTKRQWTAATIFFRSRYPHKVDIARSLSLSLSLHTAHRPTRLTVSEFFISSNNNNNTRNCKESPEDIEATKIKRKKKHEMTTRPMRLKWKEQEEVRSYHGELLKILLI